MEIRFNEQHKLALISAIEVVLMSMGNTKYNMVIAKLRVYNVAMRDSPKDPEYLKKILKDVYEYEYNHILYEIKIQLGDLVNEEDIAEFFKIMES